MGTCSDVEGAYKLDERVFVDLFDAGGVEADRSLWRRLLPSATAPDLL